MDNSPSNDPNDSANLSYQDELRLKTFLKNAAAIIAAERGLNARSRAKLESLARYQQLPERLFDQAILNLQEQSGPSQPLNRYEQAFVNFFDQELAPLSGKMLPIQAERKAIGLAKTKYQIPVGRAEQLIEQRTKLASIERISRLDAAAYASQFVAEQVGKKTELDDEFHTKLYLRGKQFGLSSKQVDEEVVRVLKRNRRQQLAGPKAMRALVATAVLLLAGGLIVGAYWVWIPPVSSGKTEFDVNTEPPPFVDFTKELAGPKWMSNATKKLIDNVAETAKLDLQIDKKLRDEKSTIRMIGYRTLADLACDKNSALPHPTDLPTDAIVDAMPIHEIFREHETAEKLIANLFFEEPDSNLVFEMIDVIGQRIRLPLNQKTIRIEQFEQQFRANRLLGLIYFHHHLDADLETIVGERKLELAHRMNHWTGTSPAGVGLSDYLRRSEQVIAVDQWHFLVQNAWSRPGEVVSLIQPLTSMTAARLSPNELHEIRVRLLQTVLKNDPAQWRNLQQTVQETILSADENELIDWIALVLHSPDRLLQEFAASILARRADIEVNSFRLPDVLISLDRVLLDYRTRELQPLLSRNDRLNNFTTDWLETLNASDQPVTPDHIAQLALMTNLNLAMCQRMDQGNPVSGNDWQTVDEMLGQKKVRLRELISLPDDSNSKTNAAPTASDIRRKDLALQRIANFSPEQSSNRIKSLEKLETVARRFDDLSYSEATILAQYFFSEWSLEETLNIQRRISSFATWPTLGLAIADEMNPSRVSLDKAFTIARLFFRKEFDVEADVADWAKPLQTRIVAMVAAELENRVNSDPAAQYSDWNRLKIFLLELLQQRAELLSVDPANSMDRQRSDEPADVLFSIIDDLLGKKDLQSDTGRRLQRGIILVQAGVENSLSKTILANQILLELLDWNDDSFGNESKIQSPSSLLRLTHRIESGSTTETSGAQMFLSELAMLNLTIRKRQAKIDALLRMR